MFNRSDKERLDKIKKINNMNIEIKFRGEKIDLKFFRYNNNKIGALMTHKETNSLWGPATVNLDTAQLKSDEIIVKDYHNNKGLYKSLLEQNIVIASRRDLIIGYETAKICKLHPVILSKLNKSNNKNYERKYSRNII